MRMLQDPPFNTTVAPVGLPTPTGCDSAHQKGHAKPVAIEDGVDASPTNMTTTIPQHDHPYIWGFHRQIMAHPTLSEQAQYMNIAKEAVMQRYGKNVRGRKLTTGFTMRPNKTFIQVRNLSTGEVLHLVEVWSKMPTSYIVKNIVE